VLGLVEFMVDKVALGQVISDYLDFSLLLSPPIALHSSSIIHDAVLVQ
jgi:hypothetical protein